MNCSHSRAATRATHFIAMVACLASSLLFATSSFAQARRPHDIRFSTLVGGSGSDSAIGVATDRAGNTYLIAETQSADFPVTPGGFDTTYNGQEDVAVVKLDPSGRVVYSTLVGGSGTEHPEGLAVDEAGNAYVVGYTASPDFPATAGTPTGHGFIFKLNTTGSALLYCTRFGGSQLDEPTAVALSGNVAFVTGRTYSPDFPTTSGAFSRTYSGGFYPDGFLASFAPDGSLLTATYFGGSAEESVMAIATDRDGGVYVTGDTRSDNFPTTPGAWRPARATAIPLAEPFVIKFTNAASMVYSTFLGGAGSAAGIAVDREGRAVAVGRALVGLSPFPTTDGTAMTGGRGFSDAYVVKLDATGGSCVFSTLLGGSQDELVRATSLDEEGNVWVAGSTTSGDFPTTPGAIGTNLNARSGGQPLFGFVARVSSTGGAITYGGLLGGRGGMWTYTYSVALDAGGAVHVAGVTSGPSFPVSEHAGNDRVDGSTDAFVLSFDAMVPRGRGRARE